MIAESERLSLRRPEADDLASWCSLRRESAAHLLPWEPSPSPGEDPCGPLAFQRLLEAADSTRHLKTLAFLKDDDALIGQFSLNEIVGGAFRSGYLGYWVGAPFLRRGLAAEGLRSLIGLAFSSLGLHRVEANIQPTNRASLALVRRLGFRREGFSPRYLEIAGQWADHERWALCAEDRQG